MFVYTPSEDITRHNREELRDSLYILLRLASTFNKIEDAPTFSKAIDSQGFGNKPIIYYQSSKTPRSFILMPVFSPDNSKIAFIETTHVVKRENIAKNSYAGDLKIIDLNEKDPNKRVSTVAQNCVPRICWTDDETIIYTQLGDEIKAPFAGAGTIIRHSLKDNKKTKIWQGELSRYIVNIASDKEGKKFTFDATNGINGVFDNKIMLFDGETLREIANGKGFAMPTFTDDNTIKFFSPTFESRKLQRIQHGTFKLNEEEAKVEFTKINASIGNFYKYYLTPDFLFTIPSVTTPAEGITGINLKITALKQEDAQESEFIKTAQKTVFEHTPDKRFILRKARERAGLITKSGKPLEINDTTTILNVTAYNYTLDKDKKPTMNARNGNVVYIMQMPKAKTDKKSAVLGKIRFEQNIIGSGQDIKCWDGRNSYMQSKIWEKYDPLTKDPIMRKPAQDLAEELIDMMRGRRLYLLQNILEPMPDEIQSKHQASMLMTSNVIWGYTDKKPVYKKLAYLQTISQYKLLFDADKTVKEYAILGFEVGDRNAKDYGLLREIRIVKIVTIIRSGKIKTLKTASIFRLDEYREFSKISGRSVYLPFKITGYNASGSIMKYIIPGKSLKFLDAKILREIKYKNNEDGVLVSGINVLPTNAKSRARIFNSLNWSG
ncbi:MAG: hypothetical protein K8S87_03290 [Planctomycetes bacterium]|nr:hypothetical protein [Planctomycetota bacterium]